MGNLITLFVVDPPVAEGIVGADVKALFQDGASANAFDTSAPKMMMLSATKTT
jgi:hypothetical protein